MKRVKVPDFVLRLDFMFGSVAFIVVFSVLFMIIYRPFSLTDWFDIFDERHLSITVAFYLTAIVLMMASKVAMRRASRSIAITRTVYVAWLAGEIVAISLLYTLFTKFLVSGGDALSAFEVMWRAFCCVTAILAIPYIISVLYAAYRVKLYENEVMRYRTRLYGEGEGTQLVNLYDGNGNVRMTVDIDSLYFMESMDNYVKVCYESEGSLHNYMLRCRTNVLEKSLAGTPLMRCHRSYIVNASKIKLLRPDKSNSVAILNHAGVKPIPVSKRYCDTIVSAIAVNIPEPRPAGEERTE